MEYTKGEWTVYNSQRDELGDWMINDGGHGIGRFVGFLTTEENKANANLIAAAPDGLEAGIDAYIALLQTDGLFRILIQRELCQLRDFIAKATNQNGEEVQNHYESIAHIKKIAAKAEGKGGH